MRYRRTAEACDACKVQLITCTHPPPTVTEKIRDIQRTGSRRALILLIFLYWIVHFSGMTSMRPYIVQIFRTFGSPIAATGATVYLGLMGIFANCIMMATVRLFGKRPIYLATLAVGVVSLLLLGISKLVRCADEFNTYKNLKTIDMYLQLNMDLQICRQVIDRRTKCQRSIIMQNREAIIQ